MVHRTSGPPHQPIAQPAADKSAPQKSAKNVADAGAKVKTTKRNTFRLSNLFSSGKKESADRTSANYEKPVAQNKPLPQRRASKPSGAAGLKPAEKLAQKQMDKFLGQVRKYHGEPMHKFACANRGAITLTGDYKTDAQNLARFRIAKEKSDDVKNAFMSAPDTRPQVTDQTALESFAKSLTLDNDNKFNGSSLGKGFVDYYASKSVDETIPHASDSEKRLAYKLDYFKQNESRIAEMTAEKPFIDFWNTTVLGIDAQTEANNNPIQRDNPLYRYAIPTSLLAGTAQTTTRMNLLMKALSERLEAYRNEPDATKKAAKLVTLQAAAKEITAYTKETADDIECLGKKLTDPAVIAACPEEHRELLKGLGQFYKDLASEMKSDKGLFAVAGNVARQISDPNSGRAAIAEILTLAEEHLGPAPPNYIPAGPPTDDAPPPPPDAPPPRPGVATTQTAG